jgi:hypothetical protein
MRLVTTLLAYWPKLKCQNHCGWADAERSGLGRLVLAHSRLRLLDEVLLDNPRRINNMANTLTFLGKIKAAGGSEFYKIYQAVLSGSYSQGGSIGAAGETLDFATVLDPQYAARPKLPGGLGSTAELPKNTAFEVLPSYGFTFEVEQAASSPTTANYALRIFASDGTELSSGTYASVAPALVATGSKGVIIKVRIPQKYD